MSEMRTAAERRADRLSARAKEDYGVEEVYLGPDSENDGPVWSWRMPNGQVFHDRTGTFERYINGGDPAALNEALQVIGSQMAPAPAVPPAPDETQEDEDTEET